MSFLTRCVKSFGYAIKGLAFVLRTQHNARIHLVAAMIAVTLGIFAKLSAPEWLWLTSAITLVWFAETMNTAFEYLCDVVQPEFHTSVGRAKDIAAGAVLITAIYAVIVGLIVLVPALKG